jgi:NAD(P)-dependent dehydrogenase (short-subunit alcohol dehydrogenase family)
MNSGSALVTGAARGIGRAVAIELARRGFDVVATMRDPGAASFSDVAELSGSIRSQRLDVTDPGTISMPDDLCVLVNNAGVDGPYLPVEHASLDDWRRVFETNVFGLIAVTQAALAVMRPRHSGTVCNVTSASIVFPMPLYAMYRASKAAVAALGESLAAEVAEFGIRVLEVQPGPIDTEMYAASAREPEASSHEEYRALSKRTHEARLAVATPTPAEAAAIKIVDAIVNGTSPLRVSCDPVGQSLRQGRDSMSDDDWFATILKSMAPDN